MSIKQIVDRRGFLTASAGLATAPADQALRSLDKGGCSLVKT
jgi:hypothetical protein